MKIYLDTCCLNRPFDDQNQPRIRLESEAVTLILEKTHQREWEWVGSEVTISLCCNQSGTMAGRGLK
jgi:hypothetical protein